MRKNPMVQPTVQPGTPKQGNAAPLVKMPANNVGQFPVKTGAGQVSKFGKGVGPSTSVSSASQSSKGGKANIPTHNNGQKKVTLGTTKHGVGEVPGYLRHK